VDGTQACIAAQSSAYSHGGGQASRAVDNNMNTSWDGGSVTHTGEESSPWWMVDFERQVTISGLRVYNRGDCCHEWLQGFGVYIGNSTLGTVGSNAACATSQDAPMVSPFWKDVGCLMPLTGRYLYIHSSTRFLMLAEVQVYGEGFLQPRNLNCESCPAGKMSAEGAQSLEECQLCPRGSFSGLGASACTRCEVGTFSPHLNSTGCQACLSGQYNAEEGRSACSNCSAGSYTYLTGVTQCMLCDAGTFSTVVGATASDLCLKCPAGTSSSLTGRGSPTDCESCSPGKYSAAGAASCMQCPPYGITLQGSVSRFDCICSPGYTGPDGGPCLECLPGTFKQANGTSSCLSCQQGTYGNLPTAASHCNDCPLQSDSPSGSDHVLDCTCKRGYVGSNGAPCMPCSTGKYKPELGPGTCSECGRGWYSPMIGAVNSSSCAACPPGKYSTSLEAATADDCIDCPAGKYAEKKNTSVCDQCLGGKYSTVPAATSISVCTDCAGGRYSPQGSSACLICPAGTYAPISSVSCITCPGDTYNPVEEAPSCLGCNMSWCAIGQYRSRCPIGSISDATCLSCTPPQNHTIFIEHGKYNDTCKWMCEPPYKLDCATDLCKRCDPGTYPAIVLVPGTNPPELSDSCRGCPEGALQGDEGSCDGRELVICSQDRYLSMPEIPFGSTVKKCEKCPRGLTCEDRSCALKTNLSFFRCPEGDNTELVGEWVRRPYPNTNNVKTTVNPDFGRFELESCPPGFSRKAIGNSRVSESELQWCDRCRAVSNYILDPNMDNCQICPPGLTCSAGDNVTVPVTAGSEWSVQPPIMKLNICPTGYKVWPALAPGEVFDNEIHGQKQECQVCPEGMECTLDKCMTCTWCGAGKYKDSPSTNKCRDCAAGKYNTKIGMKSESDCIRCVLGANTEDREGAVSINDCECALNMYMSMNRTGPGDTVTMQCFKCPAAALCPDGTCGLRNSPDFMCSGIGSQSKPKVVGTWIRGLDERFAVIGCPTGHQLINETGYELQECFMCSEGKYISNSNDPSSKCFRCPPSAICPNRGKPVFPEANVDFTIDLVGILASEDLLTTLFCQAFMTDPDLIKINDYSAVADSLKASRPALVKIRRQSLFAYTVQFRLFGDAQRVAEIYADRADQYANVTAALRQLFPNGTLELDYGDTNPIETSTITTRLPGEAWIEIEGIFVLVACPTGYLLVNTTIDTQECYECPMSTYTVDMLADCSNSVCGNRDCATCPIGVECRSASSPPWMHFIPKRLKVGTRSVNWATIKGVTTDHEPSRWTYYEVLYDNATGAPSIRQSQGQNPNDYVWEYVVECTDQTQPCDPAQVPGFYLRGCPRGTQLINSTIGSYKFNLVAQQCSPCGALNYILDPNSGGECQECPKGARCPDGDLFIPDPDGSEWEIVYSGSRKLNMVKRIVSCPPGYFMERDNRYPLEDRCLRCDANTYLLDQNNFSACLNCPVGATCAGLDDVTTLEGFWRQPDNWTNPALAPKNETVSKGTKRRSSSSHLWNTDGEVAPLWHRAKGESEDLIETLSAKLGLRGSRVALVSRRAMSPNITHRPRAAIVHRCLPGACNKSNVCLNNRTGPACGLCPDGWAAIPTGCDWCPPPGDLGMLFLQIGVFAGGGIVAVLGYVLGCWTPLMGAIPMPDWMARLIMLGFGINPDEEKNEKEEDEEGQKQPQPAGSDSAKVAATGAAGVANAAGKTAARASDGEDANGSQTEAEEQNSKNWKSQLILKLRESFLMCLRFRSSGGFTNSGMASAKGFLASIRAFWQQMYGIWRNLYLFFSPIVATIKMLWKLVSKMFGFMSWFAAFAEKHKLRIHLKIIIGYVQVLGSFSSMNVEWPKGLTMLMNDVGSAAQLNVIQLPKLSCLWAGIDFQANLIGTTAGPLILVILFALPLVACKMKAMCSGWTPERCEVWEELLDRFYGNVLFGAFLIYPVASLNSLQAFNCHKTLGVLHADYRIECPPLQSFLTLYSIVCFFVYPLGIPFLFYKLMVMMEVPRIAKDKKIKEGFSDMVRLFNKMNASLECKLIASMIGSIEDDINEYARRIEDIFRSVSILYYPWKSPKCCMKSTHFSTNVLNERVWMIRQAHLPARNG
jgi:hypothetical protein